MIVVRIREGERLDRALRRLRRAVDQSGLRREMKAREFYEKPSDKRRRRARVIANRARKYAKMG